MTCDDIWLVDPCASDAYRLSDLGHRPLGGTEATVLRVFSGLAEKGVRSRLFQTEHPETPCSDNRLKYAALPDASESVHPASTIVVINSWKVAIKLRKCHPGARMLLWLHNYPGRHNRKMGAALAAAGVEIVCVSHSHAALLRKFLCDAAPEFPPIHVIYNPVSCGLLPDETARDPDLLLFASAPHKGLVEVYDRYAAVRATIPSLRLHIADPGYMPWDTPTPPAGVVMLGPLPQFELHSIMRRALCLFYPQTTFAETFGLVIAEANALGTPVLCQQGLGANDEIASTPDQVLECSNTAALVARLTEWRMKPPRIGMHHAFRSQSVVNAWTELLWNTGDVQSKAPAPAGAL